MLPVNISKIGVVVSCCSVVATSVVASVVPTAVLLSGDSVLSQCSEKENP